MFGISLPQGISTGFWIALGVLAALIVAGLLGGLLGSV